MNTIIKSEMISRRKALSLMGLAAAFGLAAAPTVLTVSDAEAQTVGACSGVKSDVQVGTSDVPSGGAGAQKDVRSGAQALLRRAQLQRVQQPAQLNNSGRPGDAARWRRCRSSTLPRCSADQCRGVVMTRCRSLSVELSAPG